MDDTDPREDSFYSLQEIVQILSSGGNDRRFDEVWRTMSEQWRRGARRQLGWLSSSDLEDVIQGSWEKLIAPGQIRLLDQMLRAGSFRSRRAFESWAFVLFLRTGLDFGRSLRRHTGEDTAAAPPSTVESPPEQAAERRQIIETALAAIASSGRMSGGIEIFLLHFVDDLSDQEIAHRLGTTRDSVAAKLRRLRAVLRTALVGFVEQGSSP